MKAGLVLLLLISVASLACSSRAPRASVPISPPPSAASISDTPTAPPTAAEATIPTRVEATVPVSIAQTAVHLPVEQPIPAGASIDGIPPEPEPEPPPPAPASPRRAPRLPPRADLRPAEPPAPTPPLTAPEPSPGRAVHMEVGTQEIARLHKELERMMGEIRQSMSAAVRKSLTGSQKQELEMIQDLTASCEQLRKPEPKLAESLCQRALILAKSLERK